MSEKAWEVSWNQGPRARLEHAACRIILVSEDGGMASAKQLIERYLYLWLFTEMPLIIADRLMSNRFAIIVDFMILGLVLLSRVYYLVYFINVVLRKGKLMPHDKLSHTLYMVADLPEAASHEDSKN